MFLITNTDKYYISLDGSGLANLIDFLFIADNDITRHSVNYLF